MRALRYSLVLTGTAVLLFGAYGLLTAREIDQPLSVGEWLAGGVLVHDAVIAPLVFALCWGVARTTTPRVRRVLAALLVVAGTATLVAMPILLHGRVAVR